MASIVALFILHPCKTGLVRSEALQLRFAKHALTVQEAAKVTEYGPCTIQDITRALAGMQQIASLLWKAVCQDLEAATEHLLWGNAEQVGPPPLLCRLLPKQAMLRCPLYILLYPCVFLFAEKASLFAVSVYTCAAFN